MKVPEPRKLKSGSWFIQLRLGGESISVTKPTKTECKNAAQLIKAEFISGKRKKTKSNLTLSEMIDAYIANKKNVLSPSTLTGYLVVKENRFPNYIDKKASSIKDWQAVIDDEIAAGISAKTIKNAWSVITASMKFCDVEIPSVTLPKIVQSSRPWLDADQVKVFVKAVHGKTCEIPALLALHSLRRSEILALTWDRIDLQKNIIRVEGAAVPDSENNLVFKETNKTKKSRRSVPIMIPELRTALLAVPESEREGKIYNCYQNKLWEQINKVCKDNQLPLVGVHGLRHSFASLAHHVGLPEQEAMLIGGWEDPGTMHKIYEHISASDRLKAENKIAQFFNNSSQNANKNANEIKIA